MGHNNGLGSQTIFRGTMPGPWSAFPSSLPLLSKPATLMKQAIELEQQYVVHAYNRPPFVLSDGEGVWLQDSDGNRYLDLVAGIAVNALGYGDPGIIRTLQEAARKPLHYSNLYHSQPMSELAARLVQLTPFADRVHFQNSGTECNEAAIKFARKWARTHFGEGKTDIISFSGAFHGRTMGSLAATPRPKYQDPFRPLMPGVRLAEFNNPDSLAATIDDGVCAVLVEPIQGEGGIHPATPAFMAALRELTHRHNALLIFDEVQCGVGRSGTFWAHEPYGIMPDILCAAKPLAGGLHLCRRPLCHGRGQRRGRTHQPTRISAACAGNRRLLPGTIGRAQQPPHPRSARQGAHDRRPARYACCADRAGRLPAWPAAAQCRIRRPAPYPAAHHPAAGSRYRH